MKEKTFSETPTEKTKKDWLKIAVFSLIGLVLLFGAIYTGYWYWYGIQKDETADWKTYTNTKLGFSVKYPKNWPEPQERPLATRTVVEFGTGISIDVGVIYSQEKQRELTYLEIAKQYSYGKKEPQLITIDSQPAAYLKMREEDLVAPKPNPFNFVTIEKGRNVYMFYFSLSTTSPERENEQRIFDFMLSTFKFLD